MKRFLLFLLVLLFVAPAWGARTNIYCDFDDSGSSDLGTLAEPYNTWSSCFGSLAAGQCILVKKTSSRHDPGDVTISTGGSSTQPIDIIFYGTTAPDCEASPNTWGDGVRFEFGPSTFRLTTTADNIRVYNLDVTCFSVNPCIEGQGQMQFVYNSKAQNTSNNGVGISMNEASALMASQTDSQSAGGNSNYSIRIQASSMALANFIDYRDSTSTGAPYGMRADCASSNGGVIAFNVFTGPDADGNEEGLRIVMNGSSDDRCIICHNSFEGFHEAIVIPGITSGTTGVVDVFGNGAENVDDGIDNGISGSRGLNAWSNFFHTDVADCGGTGGCNDMLDLIHFINGSADCYANASALDFTPNATAGGGAACVDVGRPVDYELDGAGVNELDACGASSDDS